MRERLHLDRRAHLLARVGEEGGSGDDLLNTTELAEWLTVSTQWVEIGRHKGYGPPYVKLAGKVRYRRSDVVAWLGERTHRRTSEYPTRGPRRSRPEPAPTDLAQPAEQRPRLRRRSPAEAAD